MTDLLALYPPSSLSLGSSGLWEGAGRPASTPVQVVWGRWSVKRRRENPADFSTLPGSRQEEGETIRIEDKADLAPGWMVKIMTPGHPNKGQWLEISGEVQSLFWRAGVQVWPVKRVAAPASEAG